MPINLKQFCMEDDDIGRYSLSEPFVRDGYEWATDGRILARRKTDGADSSSTRRFPDCDGYFKSWPTEFAPYPEKVLEGECESCTDGVFQCECCGHKRPCENCWGSGNRHVRIGKVPIAIRYDRVIRDLPGVQFAVIPVIGLEQGPAIAFRSEDVEGICMSMLEKDS